MIQLERVAIMVDENELREQMIAAFEGADYPVSNPMELLPALPNGPGTRFESGEFSMSVIELQRDLESDFPYASVDALVNHIMDELKQNDVV
jgi:hypothetical protein